MNVSGSTASPPDYPVQIVRADLGPYLRSDSGIDYVHSFDSGRAGAHVMVNALTHGNELCGMVVVKRLLDAGVRPRVGRLTLSFANVAAYERFGPDALDARFVDRDFNRLWRDDWIDADTQSIEAARARQMRPVVAGVDRLLDLHSTWHALAPFFVLATLPRTRALADELAVPACQLFLPELSHEGPHLIDYGAFRAPAGSAVALISECGQHFAQRSVDQAWHTAIRFLQVTGVIDADQAAGFCPGLAPAQSIERIEIVYPVMATTDHLRLTGSYAGFTRYQQGEVAALDGPQPVLAPFDGAVLLAPRPHPKAGQQAFAWGRQLPA
ncbi:MAG: succinylglutamate desuccinylase/aspartoacylase family protein [Burkholderiaceae bacterium]